MTDYHLQYKEGHHPSFQEIVCKETFKNSNDASSAAHVVHMMSVGLINLL